jgi:hypothetical protein
MEAGRDRRGSRRCGAAASLAPFRAEALQARRLPRTASPAPAATGPRRNGPDCRATRSGPDRRARARCARSAGKMSQPPGWGAAHCPGRPLHPQGHPKILSNRSAQTAPQKASSGPTLARGASADPAGLTARARPEARPEDARPASDTSRAHHDVTQQRGGENSRDLPPQVRPRVGKPSTSRA